MSKELGSFVKKNVSKNIKKYFNKKCKSQNCSWFSRADVHICKKLMLTLNISLEQGYIEVYCVQRTVVICEEKCLQKYKKVLE